ncbi:hypothetical protein FM106_11490 [Brachybacterium faecium]|nr:hypothetical protein FM106_11490 [Brachybacterium faecium]
MFIKSLLSLLTNIFYFGIIKDGRRLTMNLTIVPILSIIVWYFAIKELSKSEHKQNIRRVIILTAAGTLLTSVLTVSLFQHLFL